MAEVVVTEQLLKDSADAIREKLGTQNDITPRQMAAAIRSIDTGYPEPTGTISITENGTANVKDYATAEVNVPAPQPNLQTKTVTENGTVTPDSGFDGLSAVVVNVSGGGGNGYSKATSVVDGSIMTVEVTAKEVNE